jgi:long-chain-alcohol oxidase
MCDALLPEADLAWRETVPSRVAARLAFLPSARELGQLRLALRLLDFRATGFIVGRASAPFSTLPRSERQAILRALSTSPLPRLRTVVRSFKQLIALTYYADADANGSNPSWPRLQYPGPIAAAPDVPKTIRPLEVDGPLRLTCDVVVIGSGAGGGTVAGELAARGWNVVVLEKGPYIAERDFDQREVATFERAYLDAALAGTTDRGISILAGACLGGGTVVNYTTSFALPEHVRREWTRLTGLKLFQSDDFGSALDAVGRRLGVNSRHSAPSARDALMADGLRAHGWHVDVMPRNVEGCSQDDVCGYCGLGCVRGAKRSMVKTFLQDAADRGARIVVDCRVDRILIRDGRAVGVAGRTKSGHAVTLNARVVVVAAGAIHSPALLLRSGIRGAVGYGLRLHPVTALWGRFDRPVRPWTGTVQTLYSDQFADMDGGYGAKFETAPIHPAYLALAAPWQDPRQFDTHMQQLPYLSLVGVLLRDQSAGRVRIDRSGAPAVQYALSKYDQHHVRTAVGAAARVLEAAGAQAVWTTQYRTMTWNPGQMSFDQWQARIDAVGYGLHDMVYGSWHQMGTCRMASSPASSVAGESGEVHSVHDLYVADASLFPTASGVNPMITIAALAYHVAGRVNARLAQLSNP